VEGTLGTTPRPVFWEELDLLKLHELGWVYPHCEEPLMWAINKQYWYRGNFVFETKGANIYDAATVVFQSGYERMTLTPVDVPTMLERCKEYMFLLESEAIEFIRETYLQYAGARRSVRKVAANQLDYEVLAASAEKKSKRKMAIVKEDCDSFDIMPLEEAEKQGKKIFQTTKIDRFLASFSGGKDSQVVLDLCTRAIPSTDFEVIYSDTGYELPTSLSLYDEVQEYYKKLYPDLRFSIARNHEKVINYWDKIGTPSDTHRWCCAVMKTAPLYRMLKTSDNKQAKVLTFDGVRSEESTRRSEYNRIGKGVKHDTVINARPIFFWSLVEIFLYLWKYDLPINPAYRQGMTRVGCLICPFGNEWNEMVAKVHYPDQLHPFLDRIEKLSVKAGVKDNKEYISEGGWKRRASGNLIDRTSYIEFKSSTPTLLARITAPQIDIESFLPTMGEYSLIKTDKERRGDIKIKDKIYAISIIEVKNNVFDFKIDNIYDIQIVGQIKKVLFKCTYCIQCETCEVECPTGALTVYPAVSINKSKCIHCQKCLDFHEKGCIAANSLYITQGGNMAQANIDRYKNFGLKEEWVESYLTERNEFWTSNHGLNENYQIPALKCWLKDAEIIDDKNNITELGNLLADNRMDYPDLVWEIIWINLSHNSFIINWFVNNIFANSEYSSKAMEAMIKEQYSLYKDKTIHNAVYQLQRTLKESPIGPSFGQLEPVNKDTFKRLPFENLSSEAVAYSIYKYAKEKSIFSLRVADFYNSDVNGGVAKEFAISKVVLERCLRALNSNTNRVLVAELNMGLDSITLREDLTPLTCLKTLIS
jgi:3'-phosphoadenosine 5'-phosphosulfate sulfotransferase (PAPS reductase)/FAD synthetase/ferredoxin